MEKHLNVNTSIVDMSSTNAKDIEGYDQIRINCSMCITTAKTRQLLSQGRININTSLVIEAGDDENLKVMVTNGVKSMNAKVSTPSEPTILAINGGLVIEDCDKKKLDQYKGVYVNGVVFHPMSFDTSNFSINGALIPYPDGAILIFQGLELTNSFIKSAIPGATYFVQGIPSNLDNIMGKLADDSHNMLENMGLKAVEPIDLQLLKSKNIHFETGWVTTIEENAEELMKIVSGYIGNTIIPTGYKIMEGGRLDMMAIRRFGNHIYVRGDLEICAEDADALAALEQLYVTGSVRIADSVADDFFGKCSKYGKLTVYKGEWIDISCTECKIRAELLEDMDNGVTFNFLDSNVEILSDVSAELLLEKVHGISLSDSTLTISVKQQKALSKKVHNEDSTIIIREYEDNQKPEPDPEPQKPNVAETRINCSYYKL
jgi:hypothetical protein